MTRSLPRRSNPKYANQHAQQKADLRRRRCITCGYIIESSYPMCDSCQEKNQERRYG